MNDEAKKEDEGLMALKENYSNSTVQKLAKIKSLIEEMKITPCKKTFAAFRYEVHKIAGSAGLYDYEEAAFLCKDMDENFVLKIEHCEASGKWTFDVEAVDLFYTQLSIAFSDA